MSQYRGNGYGTIAPSSLSFNGIYGAAFVGLQSEIQKTNIADQGQQSAEFGSVAFINTASSSSFMLTSMRPAAALIEPQKIGDFSFSRDYDHIRTLAYCSEGPVHLVKHRETGEQFVIKQVPATGELPNEAALLEKIQKHPNIIEIADVREGYTENGLTDDIVTPFADLGDVHNLADHFATNECHIPREFILLFVSSMIDALAYIHHGDFSYDAETDTINSLSERQFSIVHRDVKPLNIFMRSTNEVLPQIQLADFGLACRSDQNYGIAGTTIYQAPEILKRAKDEQDPIFCSTNFDRRNICTKEGDMYAFGASIYQLIFLRYYNADADIDDEIQYTPMYNDRSIRDLMQSCLAYSPDERPTARSLHKLSASIKTELAEWVENGGRFPVNMWPDPMNSDKKREERQAKNKKMLTGEAQTLFDAEASDCSIDSHVHNDAPTSSHLQQPTPSSSLKSEKLSPRKISSWSSSFRMPPPVSDILSNFIGQVPLVRTRE
ncbi:hypothetical protein CERZMDRAFT_101257 [Cercospora zeae-maydis SCOH1-5]|uniref:Protein kinase domain-containing protein n=1 Tax=Cercospora zeae-maydis SCOH1-5 TaxID=717836 RepID=A0A6A6F207_9PEZI|nr:hypothetical protein CERZMDRAFT_101257 [Cercospora zeae-maydis SCOH1-5]